MNRVQIQNNSILKRTNFAKNIRVKKTVLLFILIHINLYSQIREIDVLPTLSEIEAPPAVISKGLVLTSADSLVQMRFGLGIQSRLTYGNKNDKDYLEGDFPKLNPSFKGFIFSTKLTYDFEVSFTPKNVKTPKDGEPSQILRNAMVIYKPNSHWEFKFGQGKLPGNRQYNNSSSNLQFSSRSINHSKFNINRDFGLHVYNKNEFKDQFSYNFLTAISLGEGINWLDHGDTGLAYTGKVEVYPLGTFKNNGGYSEGDLEREPSPKLLISGGYSQNNQAIRERGQSGKILYEARTLRSVFADLIFKYNGWAFMSAYMNRSTDDPLTFNSNSPTDYRYVFVGSGMDFQGSYLFRNNYEISGRFSQQWIDDKIKTYEPNRQEFALGLSKYIWKHQLKLQSEASYERMTPFSQPKENNWYVRFQLALNL